MMENKVLLSCYECYKGYCKEEDVWFHGSYLDLYNNTSIDTNTIVIDKSYWENNIEDFKKYLKEHILTFEKRYHTVVLNVVMCGKMESRKDDFILGEIVEANFPFGRDMENIEVKVDDYGFICVFGTYNNISYEMCYYFLTDSSLKRTGLFSKYEKYGISSFDNEEFERIYNRLNPIKLSKKTSVYNYEYYMSSCN